MIFNLTEDDVLGFTLIIELINPRGWIGWDELKVLVSTNGL